MLLTARVLTNVVSVNSFDPATELTINQGDAGYFYLQLLDGEQWVNSFGFKPSGLRYIPTAGATMTVQFQNVDATKQFTRAATLAFSADDRSIWRVPLLASDPVSGTQSLKIVLQEGSVIRSFTMQGAIRSGSTCNRSC